MQQLELRRSSDFRAAKAAHQASIRRLEESQWLEVAQLSAKHEAELGALRIENGRLTADVTQRNSARNDALRYNSERNDARQQLLEFRAQWSKAIVVARGSVLFFDQYAADTVRTLRQHARSVHTAIELGYPFAQRS